MLYGVEAGFVGSPVLGPAPGPETPKFIAVGKDTSTSDSIVMTSVDGVTWADRGQSLLGQGVILYGIASNGTRWVACGDDGSVSGDGFIAYSDDGGVTWTATPAGLSGYTRLYSVCWTGSRFIAVGGFNSGLPAVTVSADGATWTSKTSAPNTNGQWNDVDGMSGLAIAAGVNAVGTTPRIMISTDDGDTWTSKTPAPSTSFDCQAVALNGSVTSTIAVVVGDVPTTTRICSSTDDGNTWTARTGDPSTQVSLYGVAWNGTLFAAVGTDRPTNLVPKLMTSPDGTTWTARTTSQPDVFYKGVGASSDGILVAVGLDPNLGNIPIITYSTNGTTWTAATPNPVADALLYDVTGI